MAANNCPSIAAYDRREIPNYLKKAEHALRISRKQIADQDAAKGAIGAVENSGHPEFRSLQLKLPRIAMVLVPNHHERQLMQQLRGRGWVRGILVSASTMMIERLLQKGWIDVRGSGQELEYRITKEGIAAKMARIP